MMTALKKPRILFGSGLLLVSLSLVAPSIAAQGSVFGEVHDDDFSVPPDSSILFVGFVGNTDNEIRLQNCVGAGYESGHWYDDFQNFMTHTAGLPYLYYFYDTLAMQTAELASVIPSNSYEQQNVVLASLPFPSRPTRFSAYPTSESEVRLEWLGLPGMTYHIYRRAASSGGSFFRIDDPGGSLLSPGVDDSTYLDGTVVPGQAYQYVLVGEAAAFSYSPASEIVDVNLSGCCVGKVGDVNGIDGDRPTIGDVALLIDHLFITFVPVPCVTEADVNQSGGLYPTTADLSIGDVGLLIDHLFISFVDIPDCQ